MVKHRIMLPHLSRRQTWSLIGIMILGALLRFYGITTKGLFFWDEGIHMQSAQYIYSVACGLRELAGPREIALKIKEQVTGRDLSRLEDDLNHMRSNIKGHYPQTAKPSHIALIATGMAVFGDNDYCGNVVSALLGTLTIVVVFFLGKQMGGIKLGLISSLLLAVSPLHLMYSRETIAEADSVFFFYCAFLLWYLYRRTTRARLSLLFFAGVGAGLSLTCNDRWLIIPFIFLLLEITSCCASKKAGRIKIIVKNYTIWGTGFIMPFIFWQAVYFILKSYLELLPMDYFDQLLARTTYHTGFSVAYGGVLPFFLTVARFEGIVATLLLLCGLVMLFLRRTQAHIFLLIIFFVTFSLFTFRPHHFLRIFSLAIPCFYLIVGSFLCWMLAGIRKRWALPKPIAQGTVLVLIILAIVPNLGRDSKVIHWRSHYREAIAFLGKQESPKHYSTVIKLSQYYTDDKSVRRPPLEREARLGRQSISNFPYLVVDKQRYYQKPFALRQSYWVQKVEEDCTPVFEVREDFDKLFFEHFAFEHSVDYWETSAFLRQHHVTEAAMLRIYRLQDCLPEE